MVSTRRKVVEARGVRPSTNLATILEAQMKMQQDFLNYIGNAMLRRWKL